MPGSVLLNALVSGLYKTHHWGFTLKTPPVPMSRLEHYAGQDEIDPFN